MPRSFGQTFLRNAESQVSSFLAVWTALAAVGSLLYLGLFFASIRRFSWYEIAAVVAVTGAIAVLLVMDDGGAEDRDDLGNMTFGGLVYLLLTRRRAVLALSCFIGAGSIIAAYYIVTSLLVVEYQGVSGTLVVRLPGQTVYYRPLHPYGWENTQIRLREGQVFEVEITGRVSPGLLQETDKIKKYIDAQVAWRGAGAPPEGEPKLPDTVLWDFTGPIGYPESFYERARRDFGVPHYSEDALLTVRGRPHNQVIGVILPEGGQLCYKKAGTARPCEANDVPRTPGYDAKEDARLLYFLSSKDYPLSLQARHTGVLWLTVNDADGLRFDNAGLFFVKISIR